MKAPANLDMETVCRSVESIDGIRNLHHVHVWRLDEHSIHFEGHVEIDDMALSHAMPLLDQIETELNENFHIRHVTIQMETSRGHEPEVIANGTRPHQYNHS